MILSLVNSSGIIGMPRLMIVWLNRRIHLSNMVMSILEMALDWSSHHSQINAISLLHLLSIFNSEVRQLDQQELVKLKPLRI